MGCWGRDRRRTFGEESKSRPCEAKYEDGEVAHLGHGDGDGRGVERRLENARSQRELAKDQRELRYLEVVSGRRDTRRVLW